MIIIHMGFRMKAPSEAERARLNPSDATFLQPANSSLQLQMYYNRRRKWLSQVMHPFGHSKISALPLFRFVPSASNSR
jgi:hypothetical protein